MPDRLRLLICSDLRVQSLREFVVWVKALATKPDLIIYAGDDVARFRPTDDENFWAELAAESTYGLVAIHGNDDDPLYVAPITGARVVDLGQRSLKIGDFAFHGVAGAEETPEEPGIGPLHSSPKWTL